MVRKCFGCNGNLKLNGNIPQPPLDLVVVSKEKQMYYDQRDKVNKTKEMHKCIKKNYIMLLSSSLIVPEDKNHILMNGIEMPLDT